MDTPDESRQNTETSVINKEHFRGEFASVFRSYNAMETTKRRHFDYLSMLEDKKKKFNLSASPQEAATLGNLLRDHNDEVKNFKYLSDSLKADNPIAHQALFEYIGILNRNLAPANALTGH